MEENKLPTMTLAQFRASKVEMTKSTFDMVYGEGSVGDLCHKVLVYCDRLYIEQGFGKDYYLVLNNQDWLSEDLPELEALLYAFAENEVLQFPENE